MSYYSSSEDEDDAYDCEIQFDGASKRNPGKSGAGAILRDRRNNTTWRLREGLGITTSNVAEYRGLILGLKTALHKGYRSVDVYGDSFLVYNQVIGKWRISNRLRPLNDEVQDLRDRFALFRIQHIRRGNNQEADYEANEACRLGNGCVWEN